MPEHVEDQEDNSDKRLDVFRFTAKSMANGLILVAANNEIEARNLIRERGLLVNDEYLNVNFDHSYRIHGKPRVLESEGFNII